MMSGTVWHLDYLAEMMGDNTTHAEAVVMRDLLVADGSLEWASDLQGGRLHPISDAKWERLVGEAIKQAQQ